MKLTLKKKKLKNLSRDAQALPAKMTPQVAGGTEIAGATEIDTNVDPDGNRVQRPTWRTL